MRGNYDLWLVACSYLVAVAASYAALELAGRVVVSHGRAAWAWVAGGSVAMGLGIWSMHFIGMLAFHLPIPLAYAVPITLLSILPAILSAGLVLALVRAGSLSGYRLTMGAILLGGGIAAMHYTGMAAIPIQPAIRYDPVIFAVSVAVAIVVAFVALELAFSLSGTVSRWKKFGAASVMAGGICAMHYTGMAAAVFAPDSICAVAPGAIQHDWLAGIITFNIVIVLLVTVAIAFYDVRMSDQNARTALALKSANEELLERTRHAEQAELELRESGERFRSLTDLSSDWYWEQDEDLRFTRMSGGVLRKLGWDPDSFIGRSRWEFPIVIGDEALAAHKALLEARKPFRDFVYGRSIADGRQGFVSISGTPLFDANGRFLGYRGVGRDITEQRQAQEALRDAHEKLTASVGVLERRNREIALLSELSNFLLSCVTVEEACNAVPKYCETLFPGEHGALYLFRASRDHLNPYASWGAPEEETLSFQPEECWALRRGRPHTVFDPQKDAICGHIDAHHKGEPYTCVPLIVQSDLMGMTWITLAHPESADGATDAAMNGKQQLAVTLSEQIALALSNIRLRENLRQQTIRDALTGLYNRRFLEESLNREMARCARNGTVFGVLMMDLDHFKRFNDTFGHDAGDSVLRSIAQALQENTRESDIACRFGGEEFIIVLPDTDREGAAIRAERILAVVRGLHVTHNDKPLGSITVSLGLAMYPQNGETVKAIVQSADKALYEAKGAGRDRLVMAA